MKKNITILLTLLSLPSVLNAQRPLEIIVNFPPPYPREFAAYYYAPDLYSLTIINYTENEQEIYLTGGLYGTDNGVVTRVKPTYKPPTAFSIPASGVRVISGLELSEINATMDSSDIVLNGIPITDLNINGMLPEGNYVFCLTARDFQTGQELSVGCSFEFNIFYADQTEITIPMEEEVIPELPNPSFPINWFLNLSDPVKYQDISYEMKMIDLTEYQDQDLMQLFMDPGVPPVLEFETTSNNYMYNGMGSDPDMIPGHQYGIRIRSTDITNEIIIPNDGYSEIRTFWYAFNDEDGDGEEDEEVVISECVENCYYTDNIQRNNSNEDDFDIIYIGNFEIHDPVITTSGPSGYYGSGVIPIPFLNDVKLNVTFQALKINRQNRVYDGTAIATEEDVNNISLSDIHHALFTDHIEPSPQDLEAITQGIETSRSVLDMANGTPTNVPLGLKEYIQGREFTIGLTGFTFEADRASVNVISAMNLYSLAPDKWLTIGATDVCLTPGGFGGEYILAQAIDMDFNGYGGHTYTLSGAYGSEEIVKNEASYIEVDCDGIKSLAFRGDVAFNRDLIVPDLENGRVGTGRVEGHFAMILDREVAPEDSEYGYRGDEITPGLHLMCGLAIDPFQLKGIRGWGFEVEDAWLDLSDADNPLDIHFPEGYDGDGINVDPSISATWQGFYLKTIRLNAPPNFMGGTRAGAEVGNVILDPNITLDIDIANLIDRRQGNLEGWGISLDTFRLRIIQNVLEDSRVAGTINTPIMGEDNYIHYAASFDLNGEDRYSLIAQVSPDDPIDIPLSLARASLCDNSYIQFEIDGEDTELSTFLKGQLAIDVLAAMPASMQIPEVIPDFKVKLADFQLNYDKDEGFITPEMVNDGTGSSFGFGLALTQSCGGEEIDLTQPLWEWDQPNLEGYGETEGSDAEPSPQETLEGFPISFEDISLGFTGNSISINFTIDLSLDAAIEGFGMSTNLGIVSNLTNEHGLDRFVPDNLVFNCATLRGLAIEPFVFNGQLCLTRAEDGTTGFYGGIEVGIGPAFNVTMNGAFGHAGDPDDGAFGTPDYYGYWMIDGMVRMSPGILLTPVPPVFFNGLGGGFYYNMITPDISPNAYASINPEASDDPPPISDLYMSPPAPIFGSRTIKLRTSMSLALDQFFIADPYIQATFSTDHGLTALGFGGEFWLLCPTYNMRNMARLFGDLDNTLEFIPSGDSKKTILSGQLSLFANFLDSQTMKLYGSGVNKKFLDFSWIIADEEVYPHPSNSDGDAIFWQFIAGNPYEDNMPGLIFDIPGFGVDTDGDEKANIGVSASAGAMGYFMIGQDIPGYLPDPPDGVTGLGSSKATEEGTFSAGGLQQNSSRPSMSAGTGEGIVMGAHVWASCSINAVFYASFSLFAGMDLMLFHSDNMSCYSSTGDLVTDPGMEGWYGMGQAYAGMEGTIGAKGKLFGKEIDVRIMTLTAAMMLQAGGPDPMWLDGRAVLTYNLLMGTIKGSAQMSVSVGEKCVPPRTSPFDFPVILDTYPNEGETTQIDPFISPTATFTVAIDEEISVPDVNGNTYRLKPRLKEFSLTPLDANSNPGTQDDRYEQLSDDGYSAVYNPEKPLTGAGPDVGKRKNWRYKVIVGADEYNPLLDMWIPVRINNVIWEEKVEIEFRTTKLPDSIPSDLIPKTVPFVNQEFFMQDEITALSPGRIMLLDDLEQDYFYDEKDGKEYDYFAVFKEASNQDEIARENLEYINYQCIYNIPAFENNKKYLVQIIRKEVQTGQDMYLQLGALNANRVVYAASYSELLTDSMSFNYTVESPAPELDPQYLVEPGETLLYSYYFNTSAYDELVDKMANVELTVEQKDNFSKLIFDNFEGFDIYDIDGLKTYDEHGNLDEFYSSDPLISIEDMFTSAFHDDLTMPLIGEQYVQYLNDYAGEHNGAYMQGPDIEEDDWAGGGLEGGGGNFYVGQSISMNGLAYHPQPDPYLELASSYAYPYPTGLSLCVEFPGLPQLNYAWSNYNDLTEWLNDNVTDGVVEPGESSVQNASMMFNQYNVNQPMYSSNTAGSLTIKYFVTEYCIQDAEELTDRFESALDGAAETQDIHCSDMTAYNWTNYLNSLQTMITRLSTSQLVNGFSMGGFENSIRFRANESYLYGSNIPGSRYTKTFTTNATTLQYQTVPFTHH